MFIDFFFTLRHAKLPVSIKGYLTLLEGPKQQVIASSLDEFYFLACMALVKDEKYFDKSDQAFGAHFKGMEGTVDRRADIPLDWLTKKLERELSPEEKAKIEVMGGLDKLMERLKELLNEQHERHEGGDKWIGTGGTSPFGHGGYNPEGIRIGGPLKDNHTTIKVWEARAYEDYDDTVELGTRNIKVALRHLRKLMRDGADIELGPDDIIHSTAANTGMLDIRMCPERHDNVKVLMLMDVGGSMDDHIKRVEELFSATRTEFKHPEYYYFHNYIYEWLRKHNWCRHAKRFSIWDVIRKYPPDYKLIFVGDATMSLYETLQAGGSAEYSNAEAGATWLKWLIEQFPKFVWPNPEPEGLWEYRQFISVISQTVKTRMYPVTVVGSGSAMRLLSKQRTPPHFSGRGCDDYLTCNRHHPRRRRK